MLGGRPSKPIAHLTDEKGRTVTEVQESGAGTCRTRYRIVFTSWQRRPELGQTPGGNRDRLHGGVPISRTERLESGVPFENLAVGPENMSASRTRLKIDRISYRISKDHLLN